MRVILKELERERIRDNFRELRRELVSEKA